MKSKLAFYVSSFLLMCSTLLILMTNDGDLWIIWLVTLILFFFTLPFYIYAKSINKNQYEIDNLETLTKAYEDIAKNNKN